MGGSPQERPQKDQGWDSQNPQLLPSSWMLSPDKLRLLNGKGPTGRCRVGQAGPGHQAAAHGRDGATGEKLPGWDGGRATPWRALPGSSYGRGSAPRLRGAHARMKTPEQQTRTLRGRRASARQQAWRWRRRQHCPGPHSILPSDTGAWSEFDPALLQAVCPGERC